VLFESLIVFDESETPHQAAMNMAVDEALLLFADLDRPLLRFYTWGAKSVSWGYFGRWRELNRIYEGWDRVRRWTGGGVVEHLEDQTYSLIIPAGAASISNEALYQLVHRAVADVSANQGLDAELVAESEKIETGICFQRAVRSDVRIGQSKIAGAAIRRHRKGILLQGSVQRVKLPLIKELPNRLTPRIDEYQISQTVRRAAEELSSQKYATQEWLGKF
jgi:lipoyl(octanoyl) transferase